MGNAQFLNDFPLFGGLRATTPMIIGLNCVHTDYSEASTIDIDGSGITVPKGFFCPGSTFRYTISGTRSTGTNGAATLLVDINGSTAITLAMTSNTSIDFWAQFVVTEDATFASQKCYATILQTGVYPAVDNNASAIDVSQTSVIKMRQTLANASDITVINFLMVEYWKI